MATGDAAAAVGMTVVPATEDLRLGYNRINETRDYLASHQTAGTHGWDKITGKPALYNQGDVDYRLNQKADTSYVNSQLNTKANAANTVHQLGGYGGIVLQADPQRLYFSSGGTPGQWLPLARYDDIPAAQPPVDISGKANAYPGNGNAVYYAERALTPTVTRTNRAVWMDANGLLGQNTSSKRYKADVHSAEVSTADVLALEPVTFRYRKNVTDDQSQQMGLIAEDVPESLAPYLVILDDQGRADGIRYESVLPVLLLAVIKEQNERISALESRLDNASGQ